MSRRNRPYALAAVATALALASACSPGGADTPRADHDGRELAVPASARISSPPADERGLVPVIEPGMTPPNKKEEQFFTRGKVLDDIAAYANTRIKVPGPIGIVATNCDEENANWDSYRRQIRFCYEFATKARETYQQPDDKGRKPAAKEVDDSVAGFTNGVVFHELGHALIDLYDLPTTGKEEDAVDQLSMLLLASSDAKHTGYAIDTINAWGAFAAVDETKDAGERLDQYADEHSLNAQRFYNWACWLYGSDPEAFESVVLSDSNPDGVLPGARAGNCKNEFNRISKAWTTLLKPYLKPQAAK
ncbi:DUF4344 domain-containing metallopeptidase [Streptomyces indicus]|uniref:Putative metallopeptidase n=1 Tax=Streptomyces indicus TaxID=417292 RepID=A0A1G9JP56_9ACTN|nr:DUF4344 domain-containing metallopeptidase [Streptomyces indicus]SDL38773.1 Putative metallopeptidase [Streptomyces indicus]